MISSNATLAACDEPYFSPPRDPLERRADLSAAKFVRPKTRFGHLLLLHRVDSGKATHARLVQLDRFVVDGVERVGQTRLECVQVCSQLGHLVCSQLLHSFHR